MTLEAFIKADFEEGWLYELARRSRRSDRSTRPLAHGRTVRRVASPLRSSMRTASIPASSNIGPAAANAGSDSPAWSRIAIPTRRSISTRNPPGPGVWTKWVPHIVVEVVSPGGQQRDFIAKREEYLRVGVREYWILDAEHRRMHVLAREGDTWEETIVPATGLHRTVFLPGLEVRPAEFSGRPPIDESAYTIGLTSVRAGG